MGWYKQGVVSVTQNSNAVIGTGTAFIANSRVGDGFRGPDGVWYEVTNIASDMAMSISPNYQGATNAAGIYALAPMQGYVKDSADALRALVNQYGAQLAALGTTGNYDILPANKGGTGIADLSVFIQGMLNDADDAAARATLSAAKSGANNDITSLTGMTTALSIPQGGTGAGTAAAARSALGVPGKNLIINGDFQVNQRGYGGGGTATSGLYTYDRWQVVVAGQSAPSAPSTAGPGNTVTAPAGGIMQPIEAGMISAGVYSLSWGGTATAIITQDNNPLVQSLPVVKGGQVTLIANQVVRVQLRSGTVGDVQLEVGPVSTSFERLHVGYVTQLCQRYFEIIECAMLGYGLTNQLVGAAFGYKVRKRATPTATLYRDGTLITNVNAATLGQQVYADQIIVYRNVTSTGEIRWHEGYYISAEIA
ncbi:hypothetical protein [Pseudomonas atacamensis]|uniref:hypothetical protein n=1 Tax=Pseudomonas atacamensis TaxID=2565368 RepID=UPI00244B2890|nr:hypothetical protein [Pseudomonas atacamensis]MDH2077140.1 hypothetical protein [Pseudomonas atacamensis]